MYDIELEEDLAYFFNINAIIFFLLVIALDIILIFLPSLKTLIYGLLVTCYLNALYYLYKEISTRKKDSITIQRKIGYLFIALIPFVNIVFSVIYGFRRRTIEQKGSNSLSYRPDWWKGIVIGIVLFLLAVILPIETGSGETIEQQMRTGTTYFEMLDMASSILFWPIIPSTMYFDRKYLENQREITLSKLLNIFSLIPVISFFTGILYLLIRYLKTNKA